MKTYILYISIGRRIEKMKKTIRWKGVVAIICMVFLITACGQKGDLYLPQGNHLTGWIG